MIRRLKIKFVCINMLIVTVMLGIIFGLVLNITRHNFEIQGNTVIQAIHDDPMRSGPNGRVPHFKVLVNHKGQMHIASNTFFQRTIDGDLLEIAKEVYEGQQPRGVLEEHDLRFSRRTVPQGEELVFMDISMQRSMMNDLISTCLNISILSYLLFFVISVLLAQWAVRPVEVAWKNQRQFVADASHELKTPLTVIMTNAELLQDKNYEPAAREQFASSILTMSRQMRGLVEGLLELSRVDNGVVKSTFFTFDFSSAVSDCILPFEPLFFEKDMELDTQLEEGIRLRGSESHLRQVTDILLDNAVKYGSQTRPVQVHLRRQGKNCLLSVSSAGDEITRQDLKNIFKRFYRIDRARSMNQSYGLGLSIAAEIVKDHCGKIWAESKDGCNIFYVQLPACSVK